MTDPDEDLAAGGPAPVTCSGGTRLQLAGFFPPAPGEAAPDVE